MKVLKTPAFWVGTITVLVPAVLAVTAGYGAIKAKVDGQEKVVDEVKVDVGKNKEKINVNENRNIEHAIILERTIKLVEKLERKLEK